MAVNKDSIVKVDEWNSKVKVDSKILVEQLQDITNSSTVVTYREGGTNKATHWEVIFDKLYGPDVRKWIKGLR
jgi:hypothetical protein